MKSLNEERFYNIYSIVYVYYLYYAVCSGFYCIQSIA